MSPKGPTAPKGPTSPKGPTASRGRPLGFRLAAKAFHVAREIRRDHGDGALADLLESLADELQREMKSGNDTVYGLEMLKALDQHGFNIAVNAIFEIRDMADKDSIIRAKCRRVLTILKCDPDAPLRPRPKTTKEKP